MRNIKLTVEYDGAEYAGWQSQKAKKVKRQKAKGKRQKVKVKTIQETIEKVLQKILREKIVIIGSGRTDAGVHAQAQVANFKSNSKMPTLKMQRALNALLPKDIVITKVDEVGLNFHSRFSAKSKIYRYTILNRPYPSALLRGRVYFYPYPLDVNLMRSQARLLLGKHDFKAFQTTDKINRGSLRTIKKIQITQDADLIHIEMEADGFLRNMVRSIVGTLIEIGRKKFPQGSMKNILRLKDRRLAGPTAPAVGLCLVRVRYR